MTDEEILALKEYALRITDNVNKFLINDICERIAAAGKFADTYGKVTATAKYKIYLAQTLGVDFKTIEKEIGKRLKLSQEQIDDMFRLAAESTYTTQAIALDAAYMAFEDNKALQQITKAAVNMTSEDFKNITRTLGMVDRHGQEMPLKCYYNTVMDDVFNRVATGATDYNTALKDACTALSQKGITSIGYESGVETSLEAAVRRNVMGGLGLMVEQISQYNHDSFDANGWEMSAHAMSAEDHEPYQGKQYTDVEWIELNGLPPLPGDPANKPQKVGKLKRRVGTLHCGHTAAPIIIGVNQQQYTEEELENFKANNEKGVTVNGKHYTMYQASQKMRSIERAIRAQKRKVIALESADLKDETLIAKGKLTSLRRQYREFAEQAGLRTQEDRLYISGGRFRERK